MAARSRALVALTSATLAAALLATPAASTTDPGATGATDAPGTPDAPVAWSDTHQWQLLAGLSGAETLVPAPNPNSTVELLPGDATASENIRITDDAVYVFDTAETPTLWRHPLVQGPVGAYLGPAVAVGTASRPRVAEHDGTIAYSRASDGAMVFVDPSGAESVLDWEQPGQFEYGIRFFNDNWIVGDARLFNRHTGATITLPNGMAPGATHTIGGDIGIVGDRAVWTSQSANDEIWYSAVFTAELDPAAAPGAAVGPVTTLDVTTPPRSDPQPGHRLVSVTEDAIVWLRNSWVAFSVLDRSTLVWQLGESFASPPRELALPTDQTPVDVDGTVAIMRADDTEVVHWLDLAGSATTPIRSLAPWGLPRAATDQYLAWGNPGARMFLSDATGGRLSDRAMPSLVFTDVGPTHPFQGEIYWLADHGITGGYPDGTYRPLASVNRDAMAAFLYRLWYDGADAPDCTTAPFTDVPVTHPFCGEIAWLATTGITTGWPDGTFRPGSAVTREAMAAFLYRAWPFSPPESPCTEPAFSDVPAAHPFCEEISWIAGWGIANGWSDGTFRPGLPIERQAMAAFLLRFSTFRDLG